MKIKTNLRAGVVTGGRCGGRCGGGFDLDEPVYA